MNLVRAVDSKMEVAIKGRKSFVREEWQFKLREPYYRKIALERMTTTAAIVRNYSLRGRFS